MNHLDPSWSLALLAALGAVLAAASITDARSYRIPNVLTYPAMLAFLAFHGVMGSLAGLWFSLAGLLVGGACLLPLFLTGHMGAGDVKLLAVVGAALGVTPLLTVLLAASLAGGVQALWVTYRWLLPAGADTGDAPARPKLCYGVAISAGTVLAIVWHLSGHPYLSFFQ